MIYYPGHFRESRVPLDETINPQPLDVHEMVPKKKLEDHLLGLKDLRPVVIRPGFVYGTVSMILYYALTC